MSFVNNTCLEFILFVFLPYLRLSVFQHHYLTTFTFIIIPDILDAFLPSDFMFSLNHSFFFLLVFCFTYCIFFVSVFTSSSLIITYAICALLLATFKIYHTLNHMFLPLLESIIITILFLQYFQSFNKIREIFS